MTHTHTPSSDAAAQGDKDLNISFEFFPPKNDKMEQNLWRTISELEAHNPTFVSVTYGAGGTTRDRTHGTVAKIVRETGLKPAAHLTCVGSDVTEINEIAQEYWDSGVRHIVALRGDSPDGVGEAYKPVPNGYAYASDLVVGLKKVGDFEISVAAYPEKHPESVDWDMETDNLKRKIDAGATRAITQFFFAPETFLTFQERMQKAGVNIPIVPGIMLQPKIAGLKRMSSLCGIEMPEWYSSRFNGIEEDLAASRKVTEDLISQQLRGLYDGGVRDFHIYTLNRANLPIAVCESLRDHAKSRAA